MFSILHSQPPCKFIERISSKSNHLRSYLHRDCGPNVLAVGSSADVGAALHNAYHSEARAQSIPLSKNHLVSKSRPGPDICFTLFYLPFNLQMWEHLAPLCPTETWNESTEWIKQVQSLVSLVLLVLEQLGGGEEEGDLIFLKPLGLLSGTLAVEKLWWLANTVFHKADSFLKLWVPPTLTAMIPSSLLIMALIYMCSGNIAESFFNEFK